MKIVGVLPAADTRSRPFDFLGVVTMNRVFCGMVLVVAAFAIVGPQSPVQADLIVQHSGIADPTTEGFSLTSTHNPPTKYFQTGTDSGLERVREQRPPDGEDAWWTHDAGGNGAVGHYTHASY